MWLIVTSYIEKLLLSIHFPRTSFRGITVIKNICGESVSLEDTILYLYLR